MNRALYIKTKRFDGQEFTLWDARQVKLMTNAQGYFTLEWNLPRRVSDAAYSDIGDGYQVFAANSRGDTYWQGRFEAPTRKRARRNVKAGLPCLSLGSWQTLTDLRQSGVPIPTESSPENLITWFFTNGYMPHISALDLASTGISRDCTYHTNSPNDENVAQSILNINARYGTTTPNQRVVASVWDNRVLTTTIVSLTPTARYQVRAAHIKEFALERRLSFLYTRVRIWYPTDNAGNKALTTIDNTALQNALAVDYGDGAGPIPFIREITLDLTTNQGTHAGGYTALQAQQQAQALLDTVSLPQTTGALTIDHEYALFDTLIGQEIPNPAARAGNWVEVLDVLPRPTDGGSGTSGGDLTLSVLYYITQTEYDYDIARLPGGGWKETGTLRLTPEQPNKLENMIA